MDDSAWERYAAFGGIWFAILAVGTAFLPGAPPAPDASLTKIHNYFADHTTAIKISTVLVGLGLIGLMWWMGSLWRAMVDAEDGRPRMAVVAVVGLSVAISLALLSLTLTSTLALEAKATLTDLKFLYVLSVALVAAAGFGLVAHIAAVTSVSFRRKLFATWINVVGWIAALLFLIATLGVASAAGWLLTFGLAAFLAWCLWIVGVSLSLRRRAPAPPVLPQH